MISANEALANTTKIDYSATLSEMERKIKQAMARGDREVDFRTGPNYCELSKKECTACEEELHRLGYRTEHWRDYCRSNGNPRDHFTIRW